MNMMAGDAFVCEMQHSWPSQLKAMVFSLWQAGFVDAEKRQAAAAARKGEAVAAVSDVQAKQ
eukprot:SAG31_NODE_35269_length_324_cov_1.937778_1_plen_61_part_10